MRNKPLVSICTPVYRVERYIEECVQSVFDQTYGNIELLLVDDCGGDRSVELAEHFLKTNTKEGLTYCILRSEHNEGVSAARNKAMRAATGKYIFCLDSDDKLLPTCIEKLAARAEETEADVVLCDHISDDKADTRGGHMCAPIELAEGNEACIHALKECWFNVAPWCKLIRRSFVEDNHIYFKEGITNEDAPWSFRLTINAHRMAFINEPLLYYRYNENSIMSNAKVEKMNIAANYIINMMQEEITKRDNLLSNVDVYEIWIRQIIRFYTRIEGMGNWSRFFNECKNFPKWSIPFKTGSLSSTYYRMWAAGIKMPQYFRAVYLNLLIKAQRLH